VFSAGDFNVTPVATEATLKVYSHKAPTVITTYDIIDDTTAGAYGSLSISGDDLVIDTSSFDDGVWFYEFTYTPTGEDEETVCYCMDIDCSLKTSIVTLINSKYLEGAINCDHCDEDKSLPIKYPMMHHALQIATECQLCEKAVDIFDYLEFKTDSNDDCLGC
jgi:hypothetical protein